TAILSDPLLLMQIFEESARLGLELTQEAKRLVQEFLHLVDDDFRRSRRASEGFLYIINAAQPSGVWEQMFETGFLGTFIPEFGQVKDRVQFDAYHIFPVGRHILETVKNIKSLPKEKDLLLMDIFADLPNPEVLHLAGFFHDIGKTGKNHSRRGVKIVNRILKRFDYNEKAASDIRFLVRRHLLLAETASKRDLNDEKVIVQCAREIGDIDRLKMLYLLTWADSLATGPRAWNDWVANLVQELFFKILHTLEEGELATPRASQKTKRALSQVKHHVAGRIEAHDLDALFEVMSPRYLLETQPRDMVRHIGIFRDLQVKLKKNPDEPVFELQAREAVSGDCWELTFLAKDRPGLFSDMAGVLALNNINILSAHIYTWRDRTAVDIFKVTKPLDDLHTDEVWIKVSRDLKNVFTSKLSLSCRLMEKSRPSFLSSPKKPLRPPSVVVDNKSSDFFTLIEVIANDQTGLLHNITHTLFTLGLDIGIAKIATKGDQIADVFYVRDLEGQKVEDRAQVETIKSTLLSRLD
ncbi:MAG: ACT domain-containing protein, partial [Pseudomonadota bacterium]